MHGSTFVKHLLSVSQSNRLAKLGKCILQSASCGLEHYYREESEYNFELLGIKECLDCLFPIGRSAGGDLSGLSTYFTTRKSAPRVAQRSEGHF